MDTPDFSPLWKVGAAVAIAAVVLAGAGGYGLSRCERSRASTHAEATIAAQARHVKAADSVYFFTLGRRYEVQRRLDSLGHHAEVNPATALPELPAEPPRQ